MIRFHSKKNWSKVYADCVEDHCIQEDEQGRKIAEGFSIAASRVVIAKKLSRSIRSKMKSPAFSCKKTLENLTEPSPLLTWKSHWGSQNMCSICVLPCLSESITCQTCNSVSHYSCILNYGDDTENENKSDDKSIGTLILGGKSEYNCTHCVQNTINDKEHHDKLHNKLLDERIYKVFSRFVAKRMITYMEQRRYLKKKKSISLLQRILRKKIARKNFYSWRRCQLRVLVIAFDSFPQVLESALVVITLVDTIKHAQLFRFDKFGNGSLFSPILIPGMTAHMTIVITVCSLRDDGSSNPSYIALSQAIFSIRDVVDFLEKRVFELKFTNKIFWLPQEFAPTDVRIVPSHHSAPAGIGIGFMKTQPTAFKNESPSLSSLQSGGAEIESGSKVCQLYYCPQNPIATMCALVSAPPLDTLKKNFDYSGTRKLQSTTTGGGQLHSQPAASTRLMQWWVCLRNLRLHFYHEFGDPVPRHCADLREAHTHVNKEKNSTFLSFPDGRKWIVEFTNLSDLLRFDFAISESQKAYREVGGSIFMKSLEIQSSFSKEYETRT